MSQESDSQLATEAASFLGWIKECGVSVWVDAETSELVFRPRSKMTADMVTEARRLRNCLARLIGPDVRVTMNPYSVCWN